MVIFWDVDTQKDFMLPEGKLYVPGAEKILPVLKEITELAHKKGIKIVASADAHTETDEEISNNPDYKQTFPPHCMQGTEGWEKVPETTLKNPLTVPPEPNISEIVEKVKKHNGDILILKKKFDVFSNPATEKILEALNPEKIFIYGVATDYCVRYALEGIVKRGYKVYLIEDATEAISKEDAGKLKEEWKKQGVEIINSKEIEKLLV